MKSTEYAFSVFPVSHLRNNLLKGFKENKVNLILEAENTMSHI